MRRSSTYIQNFLVELLDEARAHSHEDNVAMANAIIDIGLSGKTHQEQIVDMQVWMNTYAWAATDDSTSNEKRSNKRTRKRASWTTTPKRTHDGDRDLQGVGPPGDSARHVRRNGGRETQLQHH